MLQFQVKLMKTEKYQLYVILTKSDKEKLEKIAKEIYRGANKSQAIRWMIEDMSKGVTV